MAYSKKLTHTREGLDNLVEQFKGKPKMETLLAIYLRQIQDIENAACDILLKTELNPVVVIGEFTRITEAGEVRITEAGEVRITED